ncbi:MAG: hypothetical protein FVQ79_09880 [Planctomycetes bacterium]|nr:hypothetical protein [Planctomycetota bacterium]
MNESSDFRILRSFGISDSAIVPTIRKIRNFALLEPGWSHGEGMPISDVVILIAESMYTYGASLDFDANAFPGLHGDVAVAFYKGARCLEIVIQPSLTVDVHIEEGEGFSFKEVSEIEQVSIKAAYSYLNDLLGEEEWTSRESSIPGNLISADSGFRTWPSNIPQGAEMTPLMEKLASQHSILNVHAQTKMGIAFVST